MLTYAAVFALILAYLATVAAYLALRTIARLRKAITVSTGGRQNRETLLESIERHIRMTRLMAEQIQQLRAQVDATRTEAGSAVKTMRAETLQAIKTARTEADAAIQTTRTETVAALQAKSDELSSQLRNLGLVRYDAFADMAGRMSFSLALLDDRGDGITLSAIAGHTDTRVYAKPVASGVSEHDLTPEERDAIRAALRNSQSAARRRAS